MRSKPLTLYTEKVGVKFNPRARRRFRVLWAIAVVTVVIGSLLPGSSLPMRALGSLPVSDKLLHFTAYAVLGFLPALHERWLSVTGTLLGAISLGVLLEFAQRLSPGRNFEIADMVANACGALCGLILALPFRPPTAPLHWN